MSIHRLAPLLALFSMACSPIALSPALRTVPMETVETAREGHVAIRAGGGGGAELWGGQAVSAQGGVGIGVARDLELQLDGTFAFLVPLTQRSVSPLAAAGHVGVKHRVTEWLALTGGLGAGSGPWGAFGGGDLGLVFAYENPYAVPFFAARTQLSAPIDPRTETYVETTNGMVTSTMQLTPDLTFWLQPSIGVRFPLCRDEGCDGTRVSLTVAAAWTSIVQLHASHDGGAFSAEAGVIIEP